VTRSAVAGALVGALLLLLAVLIAIETSVRLPAFARDRGLLQLAVAIPAACFIMAGFLSCLRLLSTPQMMWAMLPVEVAILAVAAFGFEPRILPWTLAISAALFPPWVAGALAGAWIRRYLSP